MVLRDNYLGNFTHFSTLVEYLEKRSMSAFGGDPLEMKYQPKKVSKPAFCLDIALKDKM